MSRVIINDIPVEVFKDATILEATKEMEDIYIPTLCHLNLESFNLEHRVGSCRVCMVEVEQGGRKRMMPACCTPIQEGMIVRTNTPEVIQIRRIVLELLLSDHPFTCLTCSKNLDCELQALAKQFGIEHLTYKGEQSTYPLDLSSRAIKRDLDKCIMCRRCETACNDIQTVGTLSGYKRGFMSVVAPAEMKSLKDTNCVFCGQCVNVCPTAALTEINYIKKVWGAINDPTKKVVVQVAPAVRVAIGEEFGLPPGSVATGKLVSGLKKLGFDAIFDTNFAADLTIMEEANELIERLTKNENLPILTSCCPGWVNFLEHQFPDLLAIPSTCKSPQQMFGAIAKTYYADKIGIKPENLTVVSIMPCLAKKYESARPEFIKNNVNDVDFVLTTRELAKMFKEAGINPINLPDENFDNPLGESSGAADLFGVTGGVIEAALRTAYEWVTKKELKDVVFTEARGLEGIKEATIDIDGTKINIAVTSGLGNARKILEKIQSGEAKYHAIEIMACPGGCIDGGGQPYIHGDTTIIEKRMKGLYSIDEKKQIKKSHENPYIQRLYKEFLGEPGSKKAHDVLHTHYYKK
ncbi:MAG: NADH:ubiquinone oxidoreductase [Spirochaetes bacterium GWD1_27_9]|nr:MAG: NADH:ubiquinone oxidoreductase [Spirochaetes bacterium GWB1_27_13]OHD25148.1 MAG: NADH:ubiquinone oxidoreductase [Spirochaetes bacterium GWC1_27_15]OHD34474.1 MAG: NADH:ubiquinone oxidoreductase [Spirochaetes bacterium GWD1_27_9]